MQCCVVIPKLSMSSRRRSSWTRMARVRKSGESGSLSSRRRGTTQQPKTRHKNPRSSSVVEGKKPNVGRDWRIRIQSAKASRRGWRHVGTGELRLANELQDNHVGRPSRGSCLLEFAWRRVCLRRHRPDHAKPVDSFVGQRGSCLYNICLVVSRSSRAWDTAAASLLQAAVHCIVDRRVSLVWALAAGLAFG